MKLVNKMMGTLVGTAMLAGSAWSADLEGRILKIATDPTFPPMEYIDEATGEIVGFDIDVMNAICTEINCVPEYINTAWDGIFPALQQGEFDLVISGVPITEERDKTMDFSDPYLIVTQAKLLRFEDMGSTFDGLTAGGRRLTSVNGTTYANLAEELTVGITSLQSDPLGIVMQEGDPIVDAINEGLAAIKESGKLDELIAQHMTTE